MRIEIMTKGDVVKEAKYSYFELFYKKDGKADKPKKIMSFNDEFNILKDAEAGTEYDVDLTKDDNGYWQWKNVRIAGTAAPAGSTGGSAAVSTGKSGNWETSEERARRQILIVRQSSLAQAVAVLGVGEHNAENITDLAVKFEEWVLRD